MTDTHKHFMTDTHTHTHTHTQFVPPRGIYLISPSGLVHNPAELDLSRKRLAELGFKIPVDRTALAEHERFARAARQRQAAISRELNRSGEQTSEHQSLMRISYAVFCLKKKT